MTKSKGIDYKWIVLLLVSAAYFLAQGTRLIYSAVLPQIKTDFASLGISDTSFGLISSVFTWVFGLVMPFATGIFCSGYLAIPGMWAPTDEWDTEFSNDRIWS